MAKRIKNIKRSFYFISFLFITFFLLSHPVSAKEIVYPMQNPLFQVPEGLQESVNFWKDIYKRYSTDYIVIHDDTNLDIIYDVIDITKEFNNRLPTERMKRRKTRAIKKKYIDMVRKIGRGKIKENDLDDKWKRIYKMLTSRYSKKQIRKAYKNVRAQVGQRDRFLEGLKKSGLYIDKMKAIFKSFDLPVELTVLPHVESSFNYNAYSRFGAAGIWQFTRSTGRRYLKINYEIDERRDPIISTVAAAKLLRDNYKGIGNWPMAITAYNHGLGGMRRARRKVGVNIVDVIKKYKSRTFGFASRNFYAEFLAALDVVRNYKKYFGNIKISESLRYDIFKLDHYMDISTLSAYLKVSKEEIHFFNPSLRPSVMESNRYIPKGLNIKIPGGRLKEAGITYAMIPSNKKFLKQKRSKWYKVRRGDTMSKIAGIFRTTVTKLKRANNITNSHRIYPGEVLQIPGYKKKKKKVAAAATISKKAMKKEKSKPVKSKKNMLISSVAGKGFTSTSLNMKHMTGEGFEKDGENIRWIEVEPDETLGHYGDWSNLPIWKLRSLNDLSFREHIRIGQRIKISFKNSAPEEFGTKRKEYHRSIEEDFFSTFRIDKFISYVLQKGDTVWDIYNDYEIPFWLLKGYNSDKIFSNLIAGDTLLIPVVSEIR